MIPAKYQIGDKVFFIENGERKYSDIMSITYSKGKHTYYYAFLNCIACEPLWYPESMVFETKEDLIKYYSK